MSTEPEDEDDDERDDTLRNATSRAETLTMKRVEPPKPRHRWVWLLPFVVVIAAVLFIRTDAPDARQEFVMDAPRAFSFGNRTVVRVDPNGRRVDVEWSGYNQQDSRASNPPYEVARFSTGAETYLVSTRDRGDGELRINGRDYHFDPEDKQLLISFGYGVIAEPRGNYGEAVRIGASP